VLAFARLIERLDRADVRMIEGGRGAGFLLEAENASGITREVRGKKLQRDLAPKPQLGREPHLAHASCTDEGDDFVRAEPWVRLEPHLVADYKRRAQSVGLSCTRQPLPVKQAVAAGDPSNGSNAHGERIPDTWVRRFQRVVYFNASFYPRKSNPCSSRRARSAALAAIMRQPTASTARSVYRPPR
jgi:hypothetical protein